MFLINRLLIPLVLTIGIEILVMLVLTGFQPRLLLGALAVNLATNPLLNFTLYVLSSFMTVTQTGPVVLALEALVIVVEWRLWVTITHERSIKLLFLSFLMNLSSYLVGVIFQF